MTEFQIIIAQSIVYGLPLGFDLAMLVCIGCGVGAYFFPGSTLGTGPR